MKNLLMKEVSKQSIITNVECGFERETPITANCTAMELYSLKAKLDTALSHFIDEYDWTCSHLKLIADATVCWHYCHRNNIYRYNDENENFFQTTQRDSLKILKNSINQNSENTIL